MARKKTEQKQVHGALEDDTSIYDLMGKKTFPYKEKTLEDYREKLDSMSISDLEKECLEVANIIPRNVSRAHLVDSLEREFLKKKSAFIYRKNVDVNGPSKLSKKDEKEIAALMARGR